ncbi:MAG: alkane 1-monooxygenase [Bermanella sp.]|jgi:alkane 1-monooxygenase
MTTTSSVSITDLTQRLRWLWLVNAAVMPWVLLIGIIPAEITGNVAWLMIGYPLFYVGVPLLDRLLGQDPNNHAEEDVPALEADRYFKTALLFALVGSIAAWCAGIYYAWWADLSLWGMAALAVSCMGFGGGLLNLGHEMGHKRGPNDRMGASLSLGIALMPHFNVEHNRGHHRAVATPEDHASSKLGESFYRFVLREQPMTWLRGWKIERDRLKASGKSFWSTSNEILPGALIGVMFMSAVGLLFGPVIFAFVLFTSWLGHLNLSLANYIEHYGLLRRKDDSGRYESPKPQHSWNQNALVSNLFTFQLQRHSDHHAHPSRSYQCLRHFDDVPQLPWGYYEMFLLAYFPPLWFKVMDKRVLEWAGGDLDRTNHLSSKREHYEQQASQQGFA